MKLSARSTDLDISGQISVAACHTLAEAAIYAFLSAEAGWDYHTAIGIPHGPKPLITESDCRQRSTSCATSLFPSIEVGIAVESIDCFSCAYRIGIFNPCMDSIGESLPYASIRILQVWVELSGGSGLSPGGRTSGVINACIPDLVRRACSRLLI